MAERPKEARESQKEREGNAEAKVTELKDKEEVRDGHIKASETVRGDCRRNVTK